MAEHIYRPEHYYLTIGGHEPVLSVNDGDTIITSTLDVRGQDHTGTAVAPRVIPLTGPFYINEAEPGDMLEIYFEEIKPNRPWGWTRNQLDPHVIDPEDVPQLNEVEVIKWAINFEDGVAQPINPSPKLAHLQVPLTPYLGTFAVAPQHEQSIHAISAGQYGGNMDYRGFVSGTSAYLPVFVEGALFQMGDGHALQGDGELLGNGIEISMDVRLTFKVHKGKTIKWPRGESETHIITIGNARPLDQALRHATSEMLRWLQTDYGLSVAEASLLLGQTVEYEIGNVYNPMYTIACKINKRYLQ